MKLITLILLFVSFGIANGEKHIPEEVFSNLQKQNAPEKRAAAKRLIFKYPASEQKIQNHFNKWANKKREELDIPKLDPFKDYGNLMILAPYKNGGSKKAVVAWKYNDLRPIKKLKLLEEPFPIPFVVGQTLPDVTQVNPK